MLQITSFRQKYGPKTGLDRRKKGSSFSLLPLISFRFQHSLLFLIEAHGLAGGG